MRILYCIPNLEHGGAERQLSYLAAELAKIGHEVHVASSRGGPNLDRLKSGGVSWHYLGGICNRDPMIFFRLIGLMRKLRPDIVQTILTPMDIMGGAAALLTRTRWILKESSSAPLYAVSWRNRLRLRLGRRADAIVSNSTGGDDYWRGVEGAQPVCVIPNAIPLDEITRVSADQVNGLRFNRPEKVVLFAGRMESGKNVENLIVALSRIVDSPPFVAFICGDGPRRSHLERMARELGIAHRLIFTGYVSNLWTLMKRADVFASLSRFEGCPNVVMEAMACDCPLVVSDIPAHREILDDRTACFVNPDEPAEAARAIKETLSADTTAQERAQAARAKVEGWAVETMARLYEQLYLNILDQA